MKAIKVLHLSTHDEDCGIGKYQEQFLEAMSGSKEVQNAFFGHSPNQTKNMSETKLQKVLDELAKELKNYDILHVQHEFGFYHGDELAKFCQVAKRLGKRLIVTYHTSPEVVIKQPHLGGLGPHSLVHYLRSRKYRNLMVKNHIAPAQQADIVIAHNQLTAKALENFGIPAAKIRRLQMPVPLIKEYKESSGEITKALGKKSGDIIFCTVGFMHRFKGLFDAVKALRYLPSNYKLAIIGGLHPETDDVKIYNDITDLIVKWDLVDQVYIAGFVKDDDRMNKLIRECDVGIYPYDGNYYSRVSSAALNLAFANKMPVVAYPVQTFVEIADESQAILLTNGFSYYELARSLQAADLPVLRERSVHYAKKAGYPVIKEDLLKIYRELAST